MLDMYSSFRTPSRRHRFGAWGALAVMLFLGALTGRGDDDVPTDHVSAKPPTAEAVSTDAPTDSPTGDTPTDETSSGDASNGDSTDADETTETGQAMASAHVIRIDSPIQPVAADFIEASLERADAEEAAILVIELSTPGGLLTSTRDIAKSLLQARTPVAVYVSPSGAHAASAGFFILMAGDFAAMAPGTNSGAAHPVGGSGEDIEGDMGAKIEEDSAALIRSLARQHGRNLELAEAAVLESRSFTADEALEAGLIDVIAVDVPDLLRQLDGRQVTKIGEETVTLKTADAPIVRPVMPAYQRFLAILTNPAIAALLMGLGGLGLYVELTNPGGIFPGVMGAICLILGFYAMSVLPINIAGIALVGIGIALFVFEVQVPSFGLLTLGGSVCMILGSVMLFKDAVPDVSGSLIGIAAGAALLSLIMGLLSRRAWVVRRSRVTTGHEGLIGERGQVRSTKDGGYKVFVHGELWRAESDDTLGEKQAIEVVAVRGLTLTVKSLPSTVSS